MNILFYNYELHLGGGALMTASLAKYIKRKGHKVVYVSAKGPILGLLEESGIKYYDSPPGGFLGRQRRISLKRAMRLIRIVMRERIDVICSYDYETFLIANIARMVTGIPVISTWVYRLFPKLPKFRGMRIAISEEIRNSLIAKHRAKMQEIKVVRNRIDVERYRPGIGTIEFREQFNLREDTMKVVFMSRFDSDKLGSIEHLLKAIPLVVDEVFDVEFLLVGGGELFEEISDKADKINDMLKTKAIKLTGGLVDTPQILNVADLVIGVGNCALEGMACEKPAIILGENGFAGIVAPETVVELGHFNFAGRNITEPNTPDKLAEAIATILKNKEYARELGAFGRKFVEQEFSVKKGAEELEKICLRTIGCGKANLVDRISSLTLALQMIISKVVHKL